MATIYEEGRDAHYRTNLQAYPIRTTPNDNSKQSTLSAFGNEFAISIIGVGNKQGAFIDKCI